VAILRVKQFWSEIIFVISNPTCAARSFDFEITRMISDQIALHSVQLPLLISIMPLFYLQILHSPTPSPTQAAKYPNISEKGIQLDFCSIVSGFMGKHF